MILLSIFGLHTGFLLAHRPPPKIFVLRDVILHMHKHLPSTSLSLVAPLRVSMIHLETYASSSTLPFKSMPLQETSESRVATPRVLLIIQGLSMHHAKIASVEWNKNLEGVGVPFLSFHLVVDPSLHRALCLPLSSLLCGLLPRHMLLCCSSFFYTTQYVPCYSSYSCPPTS
jgi:hypothetical protein